MGKLSKNTLQVHLWRTDACRRMVSPRDPRIKVHEIRRMGQTPNVAKFRRIPTTSVQDIPCGKILLPGKVGQSSP